MQILFFLILVQWMKFAFLVNLGNGSMSYENKHRLRKNVSKIDTGRTDTNSGFKSQVQRDTLNYGKPVFYQEYNKLTASHNGNGTMNTLPHTCYIMKRSLTEDKNNETNFETWGDWSDWSRCSVTCGAGRKVRWRHCLSDDCAKGLKRAQIKPCQLKKCSTKNILSWLGIKTR